MINRKSEKHDKYHHVNVYRSDILVWTVDGLSKKFTWISRLSVKTGFSHARNGWQGKWE